MKNLLFFFFLLCASSVSANENPNIVIILADDMGWGGEASPAGQLNHLGDDPQETNNRYLEEIGVVRSGLKLLELVRGSGSLNIATDSP